MATQKIFLPINTAESVKIQAGNTIEFMFEASSVSFSRSENSLVVTKEDAQVILDDFFITADEKLPELQLMDGTVVSAESFLQAMNPDMDLATALGSASRNPSSGEGEYTDSPGDLVGSLDRLEAGEGLGHWNRGSVGSVTDFSLTPSGSAGAPGFPVTPPNPVDPVDPPVTPVEHDTYQVLHQDPIISYALSGYNGIEYKPGDNNYKATVTTGKGMGVIAPAENGEFSQLGAGGNVLIQVDMPSLDGAILDGDTAAYLAGSYVRQGGKAAIQGDSIDVEVATGGFTDGADAQVSTTAGLWADGSTFDYDEMREQEQPGIPIEDNSSNSQLQVVAETGDVNVNVDIVGNADTQGYGQSTYLGVAASDRGQLGITADKGGVNINVTNETVGNELSIGAVYGLFAGYGASAGDLSSALDLGLDRLDLSLQSSANYKQYMQTISTQYGYYDREPGAGTKIEIDSHNDVNIAVNLGGQNVAGDVSGVRNMFGDIAVKSQTGDVNVDVIHTGAYLSDTIYERVSAISKDYGRIDLQAEHGNINLNVQSNGNNVSVLRLTPTLSSSNMYQDGLSYTKLSGENVYLTGKVGENAASMHNSIVGIDGFDVGFKRESILLSASGATDETGPQPGQVRIDVEARHHAGGETHSIGIGSSWVKPIYHTAMSGDNLNMFVDAAEFVIDARVTGDISTGNSYATGISHSRGQLVMTGPEYYDESGYYQRGSGMEAMKLDVGGARYNKGIEGGVSFTDYPGYGGSASLHIYAHELDIAVSGGTAEGDSSSYGIYSHGEFNSEAGWVMTTPITLFTDALTMEVANPQHSVGISAGSEAYIDVSGIYGSSQGMTVSITCAIADGADITRGIALEAIDGGNIHLRGSDNNDSFTFNGDITAYRSSPVYSYESVINLSAGSGNDILHANGDILAGDSGRIDIDMGVGDDIIHLNGLVAGSGVSIRAGSGNDLLVLEAPDAETFIAWYKGWFETNLDQIEVENVYIKGVGDSASIAWLTDIMDNLNINWAIDGGGWNINDRSTADVDELISSYLAGIGGESPDSAAARGLFANAGHMPEARLSDAGVTDQGLAEPQVSADALPAHEGFIDLTAVPAENAEMQLYVNTLLHG